MARRSGLASCTACSPPSSSSEVASFCWCRASSPTQQRILLGYEKNWGQKDFGLSTLAPSAVGDERFAEWYAQACRFAGTPSSALAWFKVTMEIYAQVSSKQTREALKGLGERSMVEAAR